MARGSWTLLGACIPGALIRGRPSSCELPACRFSLVLSDTCTFADALQGRTFLPAGGGEVLPDACSRLEPFMASQIVGQDLAVSQASDAICDHLGRACPDKPLVLSAHGPPGVGKSLMHLMAARALHCRQPGAPGLPCPGTSCPGYRVSLDT